MLTEKKSRMPLCCRLGDTKAPCPVPLSSFLAGTARSSVQASVPQPEQGREAGELHRAPLTPHSLTPLWKYPCSKSCPVSSRLPSDTSPGSVLVADASPLCSPRPQPGVPNSPACFCLSPPPPLRALCQNQAARSLQPETSLI